MKNLLYIIALIMIAGTGCNSLPGQKMDASMDTVHTANPFYSHSDSNKLEISDTEWNKILPKEVYETAREKGTERAFSGKYNKFKETGTYYCAVCGNPLFNSNGKFESTCGWPSFFEPISKGSLIYAPDNTHGMERTEVMCGRCKSHLGHVFNDGPPPTGLRYCINSVILDFTKAKNAEKHFEDSSATKK